MSERQEAAPFAVVMLDLSGVLQMPDASWILVRLADLGLPASEETIRRAHYRAIRTFDQAPTGDHRSTYANTYASALLDAIDVPTHLRAEVGRALFRGAPDVTRQPVERTSSGATHALAARGAVVVVTNSARPGAAHTWLAAVGLSTRDQGGPPAAVADSAEVGLAKPDPTIPSLALAAAGWSGHDMRRVVFVGDSMRVDGEAARLAGVPFQHFDPFHECPSEDHEHLQRLPDLLPSDR